MRSTDCHAVMKNMINYNGFRDFCTFLIDSTFKGFGIFLNATDQMIAMTLVLQDSTIEDLTRTHRFFKSDFEPLDSQLQMPTNFVYVTQISVVMNYHENKLSSKVIENVKNFDNDTIFGLHVETTNFVAINCYLNMILCQCV